MIQIFKNNNEELLSELLEIFKKENNIQFINQNLFDYIQILSDSFFDFQFNIKNFIENKILINESSANKDFLLFNSILSYSSTTDFILNYSYTHDLLDIYLDIDNLPLRKNLKNQNYDLKPNISFINKNNNDEYIEISHVKFYKDNNKKFIPFKAEFLSTLKTYILNFFYNFYKNYLNEIKTAYEELEKIRFICYEVMKTPYIFEFINKDFYYDIIDIYNILKNNEELIYLKSDIHISSYFD